MKTRIMLAAVTAAVASGVVWATDLPVRAYVERTSPTVTERTYETDMRFDPVTGDACRVVWTRSWGETTDQRVFSFEVY